jgi:hypothetical protein
MTGFHLSKEHGLNPHLTICRVCGKTGQDIILTGDKHIYECRSCYGIFLGLRECPKCKSRLIDKGQPDPSMPFLGLCKEHENIDQELAEEVSKGGIPFKCRSCKTEGVIKHDTDAGKALRQELDKTHPGQVVGVELPNCPECQKEMA